jgi:hypothetical protein
MGMNAYVRCQACKKPVMALDPAALTVPLLAEVLAEAWEAHIVECPKSCNYCRGHKRSRNQSCGRPACRKAAQERRTLDRIEDVETLILRTRDVDTIAAHMGLSAVTLREWLRDNGRADLVDHGGPLAPGKGVAA